MADTSNNIKVAVRIRPQAPKEVVDMCSVCTSVTPDEPQICLGKEKAFTFDHVFDSDSKQETVYSVCVEDLVEGCFDGFNATVLAYGQTGSGKTYTMGSGLEVVGSPQLKGIIPRAIEYLFNGIKVKQQEAKDKGLPIPEFQVTAQFLELYNENIIDLLCQDKKNQIKIHEDKDGNMYLVGATVHPVRSVEETSNFLKMGALSRTTGSTQMNSQSSRSHAIFTLHIRQQRVVDIANENVANITGAEQEIETLTAKFHFVDLAGSERLKRTGAEGERAKEGISINTGLLALGNVISALGDKSKKATHVPYRDSKLTRFLQDSLGGNSRTLMIACISPSDRDFMETLNTLRYANRAKNIKNKVVANQDKSSQIISALRAQIQQLELELMEYKQGKRVIADDGREVVNDMFHENNLLQNEIENLKTRVKALQEANNHLNLKNIELLAEKESGAWITSTSSDENKSDIVAIVQKYMTEIETLRIQLIEKEEECSEIRRQLSQRKALMPYSPGHFPTSPYATTNLVALSGHNDVQSIEQEVDTNEIIEEAKRDVFRMRKKAGKKFKNHDSSKLGHDTNGNAMNGSLKQEPIPEDTAAIVVDLDEDEDTSNEEEDDIFDDEDSKRAQELYDLANEITIKEKLISELEKSQKKLYNLQKHYEEKLSQLQTKICEVESERDRVLSKLSIGNQSGQSSASITKERQRQERQVRDEYQKKLNNLQSEKKKLEAAKKQHEIGMRNMLQTEQQAKQLRHEVEELKKARVRLMAQMKEQQNKHRDEELKASKKIAQMSKQDRQKELKIRNLQAENNRVQALLRRREEEMRALKRNKPMSDKVAGRIAVPVRQIVPPPQPVFKFSARRAKDRWTEFEKIINKIVLSKTTIASHGAQIDRYVNQREAVTHSLARTRRKLERLEREKAPKDIISAVREEIEGLESNLKYLNREIEECQTIVMQLEDNRPEEDVLYSLFKEAARCPDEALYHFQKVLTLAIDQSMTASLADAEKIETQVKYQELANTSMVNEEILNHVLDRGFLDDGIGYHQYGEMTGDSGEVIISNGHRGYNPSHITITEVIEVLPPSDELLSHLEASPSLSRRTKGERRSRLTMTHDELVQDISNPMNTTVILDRDDPMTRSLVGPATESNNDLHRAPSAPSLKDFPDTTPPASPSMSRKLNRDENVFSRLTSGTTTTSVIQPDRGVIGPFTGKAQHDKASPLICTHIAEGHSRAVLSVSATNDVLFTGSKDCTVKIWDLYTGRELQSLVDHPDAVTIVRYNEYSRLAFSVSKSYIKVWDPRDNPARCVKTLNSSGLVHSSLTQHGPKGNELAPGETKIFDIRLSPYGTTLFSTSGPIVRFWDLRMFYCVGKLNTGHQSNITCMAVDEAGVDSNVVITGSKDHYIKIFEVMEGIGGIHNPKSTLTPPHYDGIESLYIHSDYLFSASRDACIKKWDLSNQRLIHSINQAHRDWIQSLAVLPNSHILVSGCRQGFMKLWSTETCHLTADIRAHSQAINCIDTNSQLVFTASGDNTIGLWARRSNGEHSPDILE